MVKTEKTFLSCQWKQTGLLLIGCCESPGFGGETDLF
jgi:hypothetical protein